jgi:Copper binding proteins, plastocyanin/azurin family
MTVYQAMKCRVLRDRRGLTRGLVGLVVSLVVVTSCFSERDATGTVEGVCNIDLGEGLPGSTLVVVRQFSFTPAEVRVRAGERVTWINCDQDAHTSTASNGEWASPLLATGDGFTQTFAAAGEFPYFCEPHPFMTGRVIVE